MSDDKQGRKCPECGEKMHDVRGFTQLAGSPDQHPDFICKCGHEEKVT